MANTKISALTSATTPLAGTEVLPIVQSSATVKVAVSDLTAGRSISVSGLTNTGLTASKPVFTDASKLLTSTGVVPVANGGTNASAASITAFNNITGYTASGATGTTSTNLVFSTSPSVTTPTLVGDATLSTGNVIFSTSGKGIQGTTTNDSASAGVVGQYVSSTVAPGSLIALTSGTATNITTISLTAGDWDVAGIVGFGGISGTSVVAFVGANASSTSAAISSSIGIQVLMNGSTQISTVADMTAALPVYRYSLASTTTMYLVARASYTTGSIGAYGTLSARRIR